MEKQVYSGDGVIVSIYWLGTSMMYQWYICIQVKFSMCHILWPDNEMKEVKVNGWDILNERLLLMIDGKL